MIPASIYNVDEVHKRSLDGLQQSSLLGGNRFGTYKEQVMNGMELGQGNYLRHFSVWYGHRGNFGIMLAQAKALAVASHMRKDLNGINLSRQQMEWMTGKNPFCQSTMWGEGYDFSPLYTPSSGHLVGGLPVGIQTDENKDVPYWPASVLYNYKEVWSNPDARWLWLSEEVALPSTLEITGDIEKDQTIKIVEKSTGEEKDIILFKGENNPLINLPEGEYKVHYNRMEKEFTLLPGDNFILDLNNRFNFVVLHESVAPGLVRITIIAQGNGKTDFNMRGWNIQLENKQNNSLVLEEKPVKLVWEATVKDSKKPWIAVIFPDGMVSEGKEIYDIKM
jgi:hypothetical protein